MKEEAVILIVDDVAQNVEILANILGQDYYIKVATDGQRALELANQEPFPDLILLDINMPVMNGYEVLDELNNSVSGEICPVIFITGNSTDLDEEKGLISGAVDYIKKPIHPAIVKARVKTQIDHKRQKDELHFHAIHDQLTGLYNRNHLVREGERKFSKAIRNNDKLSVIMMDIDYFKNVNDVYGHMIGDLVLKEVSSVLINDNRIEDFSARFGGEEFTIVLDGCCKVDASVKAEMIRERIETLNPSDIKITASFGVSELNSSHKSFEALIKEADIALYEAKNKGRNCVVLFTDV